MSDPSNTGLYRDPDLAQFYDLAWGGRDDFAYCLALARDAATVLDLGCGTGELAAALATNRTVTGVDPAPAMLDIARQRLGGDRVTWVEGDARSVWLGRRFDLVLLTGHAYQVFLTNDDQQAALSTIAAHLEPGGRFIFDSRNPAIGVREHRRDQALRRFDHPTLGQVDAWNESSYDEATSILSYENGYRVLETGENYSAPARIRFTPREQLAELIGNAGLVVDQWLGDWQGNPFTPAAKDIIPIGRLA